MFYLKNLKLTNFRCYNDHKFQFNPNRNIIIGENAAGKTSIVESIHCLGFVKSFKHIKDIDLITKGESFYNIKGEFLNDDNQTTEIIASFDSKDKRIIKDKVMYRNISDYLGNINIVLFSPDDLDLVKGSPSVRRKFLDQNIGQINKNYLNALIKYRKLLKERNELLKTENVIIDIDLLDVITKALIDEAKIIIKEREAFIHNINKDIKEFSMTLSNNKEWVQMVYNPHTNVDNLWKTSEDRKSYDIFSKTTTWGPTRDDIKILVNEEEASIYCSQGQIRTACIATKLALARLYKGYNDKIIVILDDVLSELDNYRQEQVLKLIDSDIQTFITTTSLDNIDEYVLKDSNILEIKRGNKK